MNTITDKDFLKWIHARLDVKHDESPLLDYMHRLRSIIADMDDKKTTINIGQGGNNLDDI